MYKVDVSCLLRSVYLVVLEEAKETESVWQKLFVDKQDRFWNLLVWVWFYLNIHRCVTKWLTLPVSWSLPWQVKGNAERWRDKRPWWQVAAKETSVKARMDRSVGAVKHWNRLPRTFWRLCHRRYTELDWARSWLTWSDFEASPVWSRGL